MAFDLAKMLEESEKSEKTEVKEIKESKPESKPETQKDEKSQVKEVKERKSRQTKPKIPEEQEISMEGIEVIFPDVKSDLVRAIHAMLFGKVNHKLKTSEMLEQIMAKRGSKSLILMF